MRLMYGAPPRPGSKRSRVLEGLVKLDGPPKVDAPPDHATEEVTAFTAVVTALGALTVEQRRRVLRSVGAWFGMTVT